MVKHLSIKNPITGEILYFRQDGPICGEASAPARWENTIAPWLEDQGFERGKNEKSVFYSAQALTRVHPGRVDSASSSLRQRWTPQVLRCLVAIFTTVQISQLAVGSQIFRTLSNCIRIAQLLQDLRALREAVSEDLLTEAEYETEKSKFLSSNAKRVLILHALRM